MFFYYSDDSQKGYIDSLYFKINDTTIKYEIDKTNADICKLILNKPLKTRQTITITTPFHVKIPDSRVSRMGHDGQSYQVSQWFPKPAVYDMNGWNNMPYLDQGEFYSEFGTFDIYLTLPDNYVVGATGDLVDGDKETAWLENKAKETSLIKTYDKKNIAFPPSSNQTKTLHYHQEKIHDFAWFADKRYYVLKGEIELPYTKNKVTTWAMYTSQNGHLWKDALEYVNDAVYYYSKWIGEYPYKHATAVEGALSAGGGMEYPNITVISSAGDSLDLESVIMHEIGHNWFYGILGSNERKNPWMDEGINSYYEYRYMQNKYPGSTLYLGKVAKFIHIPEHPGRFERSLLYELAAHLNNDQPIGLPSEKYSEINYGGIVYEKTAVTMAFLKDYLGENEFDKSMQDYFSQWKFRHPQPADLKSVMESSTGKKLSWFFDDLINTTKKTDYKLCKVKQVKDSLKIIIKNKGEIIAPFEVTAYKNDKILGSNWFEGFKGKKCVLVRFIDFDKLCINSENNCPEYNNKNNFIKAKGLFKKYKPLKIQLLPGIDDPLKTQISTTPVVGYNYYNGFLAGLAIYNNPIPQKRFSYFLMPMYGFKDNNLAGYARAGFTLLPKWNKLQLIWLGASASHFAYYNKPSDLTYYKIVPEIVIKLRNYNARSTIQSDIKLRNINIRMDSIKYVLSGDNNHVIANETVSYYVNQLAYSLVNKRSINPYNISFIVEQGNRFLKASLEGAYKLSYNQARKGLNVRLFFGDFIYRTLPIIQYFNFEMSGTRGYQDNLYDHYFIGRNESMVNMLSQQFSETDGGFKVFSIIRTWDWLLALNLKSTLPGKVPIKLFADIATMPDKNKIYGTGVPVFYDAGIQLSIINNIFDIYFPIVMSQQIKDYNKTYFNNYLQSIRFTMNLEKINPFKLLRDIH
jgi:hypothetical protein